MFCPACLVFGVERETNTTVEGTQYCGQHGIEALRTAQLPFRRGSSSVPTALPFSPPVDP